MLRKLDSELKDKLISTYESLSYAKGSKVVEGVTNEQKLLEGAFYYLTTWESSLRNNKPLFVERILKTEKNGQIKTRTLMVPERSDIKAYLKDISDILNAVINNITMNDWILHYPINNASNAKDERDLAVKHKVLSSEILSHESAAPYLYMSKGVYISSLFNSDTFSSFLEKTMEKKPNYFAHAYVQRRSIVSNAVLHKDASRVIQLDVSGFFDNIEMKDVVNSYATVLSIVADEILKYDDISNYNLRKLNISLRSIKGLSKEGLPNVEYSSDIETQKKLVTEDGSSMFAHVRLVRSKLFKRLAKKRSKYMVLSHGYGVPTGSPLSPVISNMVMFNVDFRNYFELQTASLIEYTEKQKNPGRLPLSRYFKWVYTRYADDITISLNPTEFYNKVLKKGHMPHVLSYQKLENYFVNKNYGQHWEKDEHLYNVSNPGSDGHFKLLQRLAVRSALSVTKKSLLRVGLKTNDNKTRVTHQEKNGFKVTGLRFNKCWTDEKDKFTIDGNKKKKMKHNFRLLFESRIDSEESEKQIAYNLIGNMSFLKMASDGMYENFTNWATNYAERRYEISLDGKSVESTLSALFVDRTMSIQELKI